MNKINPGSQKEEMKSPMNKLFRFLKNLGDENSNYGKAIADAEKGAEYVQKLGKYYNKLAGVTGMPQIPDLLLK